MAFIDNVSDNEKINDTMDVQNGTDLPAETIDLTALESDDEDEDIETTFIPDPVESNSAYIARLSAFAARDAITDTMAIRDATETFNDRLHQQHIVATQIQQVDAMVNTVTSARRDAADLLQRGRLVQDQSMLTQAIRMREAAEAMADVARQNIQHTNTTLEAISDTPPPALVSEPVTRTDIMETLRQNNELRELNRIRELKYKEHKQATKSAPKHAAKPAPKHTRKPAPEPAPARKPAPEPAPARKPAPEPAPARKPAPEPAPEFKEDDEDDEDDRKPAAKPTNTQETISVSSEDTDDDDNKKPTVGAKRRQLMYEAAERVADYRRHKAELEQQHRMRQSSQATPPTPTNPYAKKPKCNMMTATGKDGRPIRLQPDPTRTMTIDPFSGMALGQLAPNVHTRSIRLATERQTSAKKVKNAAYNFRERDDMHKAAYRLVTKNDIDIDSVLAADHAITHRLARQNPSLRPVRRRGPEISVAQRIKFDNAIVNTIRAQILRKYGFVIEGLSNVGFEKVWTEFLSDYMFAYHLQQIHEEENEPDRP
jgi:hypothetical protein